VRGRRGEQRGRAEQGEEESESRHACSYRVEDEVLLE